MSDIINGSTEPTKKEQRIVRKKARRESKFDNILEPFFNSVETQVSSTISGLLGNFGRNVLLFAILVGVLLTGLLILQYKNLSVNIQTNERILEQRK